MRTQVMVMWPGPDRVGPGFIRPSLYESAHFAWHLISFRDFADQGGLVDGIEIS